MRKTREQTLRLRLWYSRTPMHGTAADGRFVQDATQLFDVSRCSEQTRINIVNGALTAQSTEWKRVCAPLFR